MNVGFGPRSVCFAEHHAVNCTLLFMKLWTEKKEQIALLSHLPTLLVPFSDVSPALQPDLPCVPSSMPPGPPGINPWLTLRLCP